MTAEWDYKVSLIILYDLEHRLLLQHRTKDAQLLPDHWAFFGGGINKGEAPLEAVKREALEELNHQVVNPELFSEQPFKEADTEGYLYIFIENFTKDKSCLKLNEGQGWGWFKNTEISQLKMIDRDKQIVNSIFNHLKYANFR